MVGREHRLAGPIQCIGVRREVVIERDVLLEDDDEVFDRSLGIARATILFVGSCRDGEKTADEHHHVVASAATARCSLRTLAR